MNVRWDAVVTNRGLVSSRHVSNTSPAPDGAGPGDPIAVRVRLFGMLVGPEVTNPILLQFATGCTLRDVIEELGRRLGSGFLRTLVREDGESFNTCRLFVDGEPVHGMATPISPRGRPGAATIEIILLREIEGG